MTVRNLTGLVFGPLLFALAACTTVTPYQAEQAGYGYSEPTVEGGTYNVTFRGNANTPREVVEDYLLLRMAELTLDEGHTHFTVKEQGTDCFITVRTSPTSECTIHRSHKSVYPYYSLERDPRWFWQSGAKKEFEAIAFFVMQDSSDSEGLEHNYLANSVVERLAHLKD